MTAGPFLLQMPDPDTCPARALSGGFDTLVIFANSAADATAMAKSLYGAVWGTALVTPAALAAASTMSGFRLRATLFDNNGVQQADLLVKASGAAVGTVAATGALTSTQNYANGETVTIGSRVYTFKTALTPADGEILVGVDEAHSIANLHHAINNSGGVAGTDYSVTAADPNVTATDDGSHVVTVTAKVLGTDGNSIASTTTAAHATWGGATLSGGVSTTDKVSSLADLLVSAINSAGIGISGASYNTSTHVLTLSSIADNKGNWTFNIGFYPPEPGFAVVAANPNVTPASDETAEVFQDGELNNVGVTVVEGFPIPGMVTATTMGGIAGAALSATLVADTYTVPTVNVASRSV